jgi:hypothetical protein
VHRLVRRIYQSLQHLHPGFPDAGESFVAVFRIRTISSWQHFFCGFFSLQSHPVPAPVSAIINCNVALPFEIDFIMAFFETFLQKQNIVFMSVLRLTSVVWGGA